MSAFRPGDVIEIRTDKGQAYVQVTHNHPAYPEVIRALPGLYQERPNLSELANQPSVFSALMPLQGAIARGSIPGEYCETCSIPEAEQAFPTFKMAIRDKQGSVAYWWLWDGEGLRYDPDPEAKTDGFPSREIMSAKALLDRLRTHENATSLGAL